MILALMVAPALSAFAQVTVKDPWVRATVAQQKATGAFMQLIAKQDARLIEAHSPVAGRVEIHEMTMADNVMKMRAISGLELPAGKTVEIEPGGYHIMLLNLNQQIKAGALVPMTLVIETKGKKRELIELKVPVHPLNGVAANGPGH